MLKRPSGQKRKAAPKPHKTVAAPKSRASVRREATKQEVGDVADKITRAPKKPRRS